VTGITKRVAPGAPRSFAARGEIGGHDTYSQQF